MYPVFAVSITRILCPSESVFTLYLEKTVSQLICLEGLLYYCTFLMLNN